MLVFNNLYILIGLVTLILLVIIAMLIVFMIKIKYGWLYIISALLVIFSIIYVYDKIVNAPFYKFSQEVCTIYPEIEKVKYGLRHSGALICINVYMKEEVGDEIVEDVFIDLMKRVNEEPLSEYLKQKSNSIDLFLEIYFYNIRGNNYDFLSGPYHRTDWFTEANKEIQIWRNEKTHKEYRYSDYKE